ncbi:hypothetical protein GQ53DRAFT_473845 [Thozetella sp. PMI_491]|nr:hypothetical protein GQ53DRAFT_473845 [Thozetella sp. PMI_491]
MPTYVRTTYARRGKGGAVRCMLADTRGTVPAILCTVHTTSSTSRAGTKEREDHFPHQPARRARPFSRRRLSVDFFSAFFFCFFFLASFCLPSRFHSYRPRLGLDCPAAVAQQAGAQELSRFNCGYKPATNGSSSQAGT